MLCPVRTDGCRAVSSHRCQHKPASPVVLWPGGQKGDLGMRKFTEFTEQFYQSHNHTRKRVCQGMLLHPGLTTITSFPQGHPGLIIHNPSSFQNKVLPYERKKTTTGKRTLQVKGEQGARVRLSSRGKSATEPQTV